MIEPKILAYVTILTAKLAFPLKNDEFEGVSAEFTKPFRDYNSPFHQDDLDNFKAYRKDHEDALELCGRYHKVGAALDTTRPLQSTLPGKGHDGLAPAA